MLIGVWLSRKHWGCALYHFPMHKVHKTNSNFHEWGTIWCPFVSPWFLLHHCTLQSETFCPRLQALRLFATDPLLPYSEIANLSQLRYLEIQFDTFYREHRDDFLHRLGQLRNLQVLKIPTCFGLSDSQALSLISSCASLTHLSLPCNSKIAGWVLESLLQSDHRAASTGSHLEHLALTVNSAYVPLTSCIPEPLATVLVEEAKTSLNLSVTIAFTHKKLPSFNPKGFCDSNDCSFWLDGWLYGQYISKTSFINTW